ncbi:hypothetical protein [Alicyclobacillus hesperidum]|uniref:hypothetical protein n=1 Tax=Alicyclobacillus hesperidum TaxID=89784 RepID=UPI0007193A63|nr:hypothetical protein [Alicyclobacillus hesperidum]KRW92954.1 hypothetical protein SD51_01435 [Alicyclobacillus tengchongensis]
MRRIWGISAIVAIVILFGIGAIWSRQPIMQHAVSKSSRWWAGGGWRVNAIVDRAHPLTLRYDVWTTDSASLTSARLLNHTRSVTLRNYWATHIGSQDGRTSYGAYHFVFDVMPAHSLYNQPLNLYLSTNLWQKVLPYGSLTCRVISHAATWLDVDAYAGGASGPIILSSQWLTMTLTNHSPDPVSILGLEQAGDDWIGDIHYSLKALSSPRPDDTRVFKAPVVVQPGKAISLLYKLSMRPESIQRGLVFQPALRLEKGKETALEVLPPVTLSLDFTPGSGRVPAGTERFVTVS